MAEKVLVVTKLKETSNGRYYSVYLNKKYTTTLLKSTVRKFALSVGSSLKKEAFDQILEADETKRVQDYSLRLLSRRGYSESEFRERLAKKGFSKRIVEQVIENLKSLDYLSNKNFIKSYVSHSLNFRRKGKMAIKSELLKKGFSTKEVDEYLLNISELPTAKELVEKYLPRVKKQSEKKFSSQVERKSFINQKLKELLLRRGFTHRTVEEVLSEI